MKTPSKTLAPLALCFLLSLPLAGQEGQLLPKTLELGRASAGKALALFKSRCIECHEWAGSYEGVVAVERLLPGKPEESELFAMVSSGQMPLVGQKLNPEELGMVRDWILAGAPRPGAEDPGAVGPGADGGGAGPKAGGFLGFPSKTAYHRTAGWTSAGLLLAAGIVGSIHAYDLMSTAHAYRDSLGITEENIGPVCYDKIAGLWSEGPRQALRWTHVGLLVAGESVYLGNALTGMSMSTAGLKKEGISRSDIHRWGFFLHAGLMATEIVLGFLSSDALRRGDHETVSSLGVAHAAVGLAIPLVIIGSGLEIEWGRGKAGAAQALSAATP